MKKPTNEAVKLARYISSFLNDYAPSRLTMSGHTLRSYRYTLVLYLVYLETQEKISIKTLGRNCFERTVIEGWLLWLKDVRGNSVGTVNNRLASMRSFIKYLASRETGYLYLAQEAALIPRKKSGKKKGEGLSREAVKALLESVDPSNNTGRRDLTIMVLLYGTAARLDEILSLKNEQVHLYGAKPYITIIGKGGKIRTMYLLPKAVAHVRKYQEIFHEKSPDPQNYLFYSRNGGSYGKLTQPAVAKRLKKYAEKAHEECKEVPLGLHAHQFRHAKATHWLEDGMNIVQISHLLGHEQLETTMLYLDVTLEEERRALVTLESEEEKKITPKWKSPNGSLLEFCGLK